MDADRLFVETLDELSGRTRPDASEYSLLRAAGLLRELLLDEQPLAHQANIGRKLTLRFSVRVNSLDVTVPMHWWLGLDPATTPDGAGTIQEVDLAGLLRIPVIQFDNGQTIMTLRQVIKWAANVRGGVHLGPPKETEHRAFDAFPVKLGFRYEGTENEIPLELEYVRVIAPIVIRGLKPLRDAVFDPGGPSL